MRCRGYRQSVTLQELQGSTVGGTRGETQQTWKDFRTVRASVRELSARERELGRQIDVVATHEVRMHYQGFRLKGATQYPAVQERHRLHWTDAGDVLHTLEIVSVENVGQRDRELVLGCTEIKPDIA